MIKVTGLWKQESKDGKTYYTGTSGAIKYLIFPNKDKKSKQEPDVILYLDQKAKVSDNDTDKDNINKPVDTGLFD